MRHSKDTTKSRSAFTLVELLVVITILSIILAITIPAVNFGLETERIRSGAAQVQSFIAGARDRAIQMRRPIGVRLFLDNVEFTDAAGNTLQGNRRTVSSMIYIDPTQTWSDGTIRLERFDRNGDGTVNLADTPFDLNGDGDIGDPTTGSPFPDLAAETAGQSVFVVAGAGTAWWELKRRGMLVDGLRIQIPAGGTWYPISTFLIDTGNLPKRIERLLLQVPYRDDGDTPTGRVQAFAAGGPEDYVLELPPAIMPMEPSILPDNVVIDLDGSQLPASWAPVSTPSADAEFSQFMDIVFSPRGTVIGDAASAGVIHLYVCDSNDSITIKEMIATNQGVADFNLSGFSSFLTSSGIPQLVPPDVFEIDVDNDGSIEPDEGEVHEIKDRRVVTLFTQTGAISVHPVNPVDALGVGLATDPYLFAETGEEAN